MSSSTFIESLEFVSNEIIIYIGISMFITGIIGNILHFIVFISLRTFRQSSCAFYLIIMSLFNIGQLIAGLLSRIIITKTNVDWTRISLFYCKFRPYLLITCAIISLMCMCLATIDQYLATSSRHRWQRLRIPYLIYYTHIVSSSTGSVTCRNPNAMFTNFVLYFYQFTLGSILPLVITILFGLLAYYNVRQLAYRTVPLVRRELDEQLTVMVLVHDVCTFVTIAPNTCLGFLSLSPNISQDPVVQEQLQLAGVITAMLYYVYFASPFYIYMCTSKRFRRQLMYVLFKIHHNYQQQPEIVLNQVAPQI